MEVTSASAALEQLRDDGKFDVAIVDADASGLDGKNLVAAIRELPGRAGLPIILLCGATTARKFRLRGERVADEAGEVDPAVRRVRGNILAEPGGRSNRADEASSRRSPPPPEPVRVLFAMGASDDRASLSEQFGSLNCRLDLAASHGELIDAVRRRAYDIIFLDLRSSVSEGYHAARQIRSVLPATDETWLVALMAEFKDWKIAKTMPGGRHQRLF